MDVSIPYPAGMALWPALGGDESVQAREVAVSIPYPAGMALWQSTIVASLHQTYSCLNPLSSGDGFVAGLARRRRRSSSSVSIPYPAGMALWPIPLPRAIISGSVSIPYPAGMALRRAW